jgi:hypothetical protein
MLNNYFVYPTLTPIIQQASSVCTGEGVANIRVQGRKRGLFNSMENQEGRAATRSICDPIPSWRDANGTGYDVIPITIALLTGEDGLKDFLFQERYPLPLLPNIMGIMERSLRSKRRAVDLVAASQPETVRSMSSRITQQSNSDQHDIPTMYVR